jgi:TatD DNase family protein
VRSGVVLERVRLVGVAPATARLPGIPASAVEGRPGGDHPMSPPELFDTHAHLHFPEYADDRAAVLARARAAGVGEMVTVGTDLATSEAAIALASAEPGVWASVGVHPHDAATADAAALAGIEDLARAPRVVAIGEIGLDFFRNLAPRDVQLETFRRQLDLARRAMRPVIIHCRDAHAETLDILGEARVGELGGVMHCFSGDVEVARRCLDLGLVISLAGPVTYRNARALPDVARFVPADRLVLETDCPFLPPEGHRGQRNEPAHVRLTAARVAALRGESLAEVAAATSRNARALFRLGREPDGTARSGSASPELADRGTQGASAPGPS